MNGLPARLRLVRVRVPLVNERRSAHGAEHVRDSVLVGWTGDEGTEGWAECPTLSTPGYATETTDAAWQGLTTVLGPALVMARSAGAPTPGPVAGLPAATAALADAALDARLRAAGRSLRDELGAERSTVSWTAVLAGVGADPEESVAEAAAAVAQGAAMVKVKVGGPADLDTVVAVQEAVTVAVAVDANGCLDDRPDLLERLDRLGLAHLEQPLAPGRTWDELAGLRAGLRTPLVLDESLRSADAVRAAVLAGAVDGVSVKPARLGGVAAAAVAARFAADHGVEVFVGGMYELGLGRAAALAVAGLDACTWPTDLGPSSRYVAEDLTEPLVLDGRGEMVLPTGPGCGRRPDPARLARWTVDEVVLG
ncbi:MAG: enolase C-terminal domain-like protein [Microthrixaceae bacterium]